MFWEFRKRVYRNFLLQLSIVWLGAYLLIMLLLGDNFANNMLMKVLTYSGKPIEINPGEDLSEYAYKNVRCTFKYVINPVINYYETNDPNKTIYTCGFVVLDDNMENPFCVFVPPTKRTQMEALMDETWKIKRGETNGDSMSSVTVEGRVRRSENKIYNHYLDALHYLYGEDYVFSEDGVFYIDDGSSVAGYDQDEDDAILVIGFLFILIFYGAIAYTIFRITQILSWQKPIRRFIKANNLSKEGLLKEFSLAEQVAPNYWISPQYTFYLGVLSATIIKNDEIEQCYQFTQINGKYRTFYVGLDTEQKKRYKSGAQKTTNDVQKVLQYYEANFPHIKIGKAIIKKY